MKTKMQFQIQIQLAQLSELQPRNYKQFWLRVAIYAVFVLSDQTTATILGRLYYSKGGQSKWVGTLVQIAGFPILIPYYYFFCSSKTPPISNDVNIPSKRHSSKILLLPFVYLTLGLVIAGGCFLSSIGLLYLLLSLSFVQPSWASPSFSPSSSTRRNSLPSYSTRMWTFAALTQFAFRKVIKFKTIGVVVKVIIYELLFASSVTMVGLCGSGEWKGLREEFERSKLGKVSYLMTLFWTAISWQVFAVGSVGLIFEVSSLFSSLGLPLVQVLAVVIFHNKMDGLKLISLVLAIRGFVSYIYQHYLDDYCNLSKTDIQEEKPNDLEGSKFNSSVEEVNQS
ncbi:Purine permease [Parasponia andersonii]|uniref:Probable purine permease n=1 Tax=Parasponia andersonii TaxID=3476 RepID=A0A2P5BHS7_PARAD|nr:Purine permease [Parasponia andersonii]